MLSGWGGADGENMRNITRRDFVKNLACAGVVVSSGNAIAKSSDYYYMVAADPQLWWHVDDDSAWKNTISVVNKLQPDFLVVCGDMITLSNDPRQLDMERADKMAQAYLDAVAKLDKSIPLYHAAGNHDVCQYPSKATLGWYEKRFGKAWYSFEHKKSLHIVLESNTLIHPEGALDQAVEQMAWLEKLLKKSKNKNYEHRTVYMHHPLFVQQVDENPTYHNVPPELRMKLLKMFHENSVEMVMSGHLHSNGYSKYKDVELITTASCCHADTHPSGLRIIHVNGEKVFDNFFSYQNMPKKLTDFSIEKKS